MMCFRTKAIALLIWAVGCSMPVNADEPKPVDVLLSEARAFIFTTPEKASVPLASLQALRATFTQPQNEAYHRYFARYLGFQGRHEERIALVRSFIDQVKTPATRAALLYDLIDGNRALGHYESALQAMNESILLLPALENANHKLVVLQGAETLLTSMHAYEEALVFAERISDVDAGQGGSSAQCHGLADKVELNFKLGKNKLAHSLVQPAVLACDATGQDQMSSLIVKSFAAVDALESGDYSYGISYSLPLVQQFVNVGTGSNWLAALEEALARAYLKIGNLDRAEYFGTQAYQLAKSEKDLEWQEKTSETMALIKRAQGQFASAVNYYDINLAFKKQVLNDQQQKNLAYQRVKFDTQDKANQMALLEQKNKTLNTEKALQQNKYQNLILLLTLGLVVLAILGTWLFNTLRLKNRLRVSAQVDGLTQVSNRAYFTACAQGAFKDLTRSVSLVLFDMDLFKRINDTYGHAAGDWVLTTVCATVKGELQSTHFLGRLGGEEFAFCMPNSTQDQAEILAERCRSAIAAIDTHPSGFEFHISASFGISTRAAGQSTSFEETLVQADKALYLSKNEGRNRVTVYLHSGIY